MTNIYYYAFFKNNIDMMTTLICFPPLSYDLKIIGGSMTRNGVVTRAIIDGSTAFFLGRNCVSKEGIDCSKWCQTSWN